jgi:hypothetical protein
LFRFIQQSKYRDIEEAVNVRIGPVVCCIMTFLWISVPQAQIITDGLVSYYAMDKKDIDGKTLKDVFGDKHGNILGEPRSVPGHLGDALQLGGNPDSIELPPVIAIGEDNVTYECWFNKNSKEESDVGWQYLISNKADYTDNFFRLGFNQNTGQLRYYTEQENNENKAWVTNEDYDDDQWHHVVAIRDKNIGRIYVDSELVKEDVAMVGSLGGDITNWFLAQGGNGKAFFIGGLDEVRFYKRALSPEEIKQNFESKISGFAVSDHSDRLTTIWGGIKME